MPKNPSQERRQQIKTEFWAADMAWTGEQETGWFRAPRTLPLILMLMRSKKLSGNADPGTVYLELLARHRDSGIVEMASEGEHSFAAGYSGTRGARTWMERMSLLQKLGFIKSKSAGNQKYKYVMLVHPTVAMRKLKEQGKVPTALWDLYRQRQIESKEATYDQLMARNEATKTAKATK